MLRSHVRLKAVMIPFFLFGTVVYAQASFTGTEEREAWLRNNSILCESISVYGGRTACSAVANVDGWFYVFDRLTDYRGVIFCEGGHCESGSHPSAGLYLVPIVKFSGRYSRPEQDDGQGMSQDLIVPENPGPIVWRIDLPILFHPLVWFLKLNCSKVGLNVDCDQAYAKGKSPSSESFVIESDEYGRIRKVEGYGAASQLQFRQRFFYEETQDLSEQFTREYERIKGKSSLLYVSDPFGRNYHVLFGF